MKTTIKTLKRIMLVAVFSLISTTAFSATYYVCGGSTVTFDPGAPVSPISYTWSITGVNAGAFAAITPVAGKYPVVVSSTPGTYTVVMRSTSSDPAICAPADVSNDIIVLPTLTFDLATAPSNASYCTSAGAGAQSVVTPTAPASIGFPSGTPYSTELEALYSYSVLKPDASTVDGATIGTVNQTTGAYTLTATALGDYIITGTVKYKNKTGFTNLLSGGGCPTVGATTQKVTVIAAPSLPTIVVTAN